ncbi:MAG: hypothetical protein EZS28_002766 [Streblomastix strix]|uniref:KilA-N domain-containing protein n=1 Tax=Streblomastix strix TaxID=222440 RepID=A0A5J4X5B6_9EUKA|nr:MAG: hypothetical protein EZS28_002766 [Streblomastix strix]
MIFDDIGSNADIQRFSSSLAKTIIHLVSDSRHRKNTIFFIAQRPSYLFKTARILSHVICLGVNSGESDLKQERFRNLIESQHWKDYLKAETDDSEHAQQQAYPLVYDVNKGFENAYKGYYISPILINYVATWIEPKYAVYVHKIMDQVNSRVQATINPESFSN